MDEGGLNLHKHDKPVTGVSGANGAMPALAEASNVVTQPLHHHAHVTEASGATPTVAEASNATCSY